MVSKDMLHELFEYRNGKLFSKVDRYKSTIKKGDEIGYFDSKGYLRTGINYKLYKIHRLIFMMFYGYMPTEVDHINGIKSDNRIENLRTATRSQNEFNKLGRETNFSGLKNISFEYGKWRVRLSANNKIINIGSFEDIELAELVAIEARNKFHGNFAKH